MQKYTIELLDCEGRALRQYALEHVNLTLVLEALEFHGATCARVYYLNEKINEVRKNG